MLANTAAKIGVYKGLDPVREYLGPFVDLDMAAWILRERRGDGGLGESSRHISCPAFFH